MSGFTWEHVLYRFYDRDGDLLYVGITNSIQARFKRHSESQPWWLEVSGCRVEFHPDRAALARAEQTAIKYERPQYNIHHAAPAPIKVAARHQVGRARQEQLDIPRKELPLRQRVSEDEWAWIHCLPPYEEVSA